MDERPTADWHKRSIILVNPSIWPRYTSRANDLRPLFVSLTETLRRWDVAVEILEAQDAPVDIWIRDWGFTEGTYFHYEPDYAAGLYSRAEVARARSALSRRIGVRCRLVPLVLDGGNLVHNGSVAIVTKKVLRDNADFNPREIERAILALGFERVVFIPTEPGDKIGHADGMCRFVNERTLLVNDYPASMRSLGSKLRRLLHGALPDLNVIELPWFFEEERLDDVPSAVGCYMNFIQLAQGIVVPAFSHQMDDRAAEILASLAVGPVASIAARPLARLGGVFNCISLSF